MRYIKVVLALLLAAALLPAAPASAQTAPIQSGYVLIRSGPVVASEWDRPKVVVEFGNVSSQPIEVAVACSVSDVQVARVVRVQSDGPFAQSWIAPDGSLVRFFESVQSPNYPVPPFVNGLTIPPHSRYRVSFRLRIYSEDGSDGTLTCSAYKSWGNHGTTYGQMTTYIWVE